MIENNDKVLRRQYDDDQMPSKRKMPKGKQQFGIIVPTAVHQAAAHMAVNKKYGPRISDVYTEGIKRLIADEAGISGAEHPGILDGAKDEDIVYFKALRSFLATSPDPQSLQILKAVLGRHLPEELLYERPMAEKQA